MTEAFETNRLIYQEIVKLLKVRKTVTKKEVEKRLNEILSGNQRYRLTRILAQMLKQKMVEIHGSKYRGHYRLCQEVDVERSWITIWEELKKYDRTRAKEKSQVLLRTPQVVPPIKPDNHLDQVAIAMKAQVNAKEALRNLDKIQLLEELIRTRERTQIQAEQLRETRTQLGALQDDYEIAMKQNTELLQENAALHVKLNRRGDGKLS